MKHFVARVFAREKNPLDLAENRNTMYRSMKAS
jgi:hypothetical protein